MQVLIDFCDPYATPFDHAGEAAKQPTSALRCAFEQPLQTLVAHTVAEVKPVLDAVQQLAQQGLWCVGYVRYEAAVAFDTAFTVHAADPENPAPLAWFGVYAQALPWPAGQQPVAAPELTQVDWHTGLQRGEFEAQVARIHQAIAAGELYQVNYTAPLKGSFTGQAQALFERLHRAQPNSYAAYLDTGYEQVLSVSPELFFDWQGDQILTRPMKGTAPRGASTTQDQAQAQALQSSPKERAENVMIVDLLRNDLSRIAQPHSVKVPALFQVQTLPTVLQMVSDVTATTRPGTTLTEVFAALFPCGSITGAPKVRAMHMIAELEPEPRGIYCGALGVVRPGGHATFNVAIRTVTLQGTRARCGIGSGITFDAKADAEWQEWQHKRGFLERASHSFKLLETLRLENSTFHNLEAHLARLERAAAHFGYYFDEAQIRQTLKNLACDAAPTSEIATASASASAATHTADSATEPAKLKSKNCTAQTFSQPGDAHKSARVQLVTKTDQAREPTIWRVRLQLDSDGKVSAEKFIQNSTVAPVQLALAATPFEAFRSEFTRFKTTRRAHYEAYAPTDPAIFDTLLYNPHGELTECTRGNIAVLLDGQWLTPALSCGLLDGVGRAEFLASGKLREATLTLADLPRITSMAFINSLRGWVVAALRAPNS